VAKFYEALDEALTQFIREQHIFFVASATVDSRVNVSPKGMNAFRVLDERTVAYLDLTGSGNETAAHIAHGGRMTIMFCAFEGRPKILRLYGHGRVVVPGHADWHGLFAQFESIPGARQIIVLSVESLQTSCGMAVPLYSFESHRNELVDWAVKKRETNGLEEYWKTRNATSIDGLSVPDRA
jgi:hypothetical protein